jgi:hypothetical protein
MNRIVRVYRSPQYAHYRRLVGRLDVEATVIMEAEAKAKLSLATPSQPPAAAPPAEPPAAATPSVAPGVPEALKAEGGEGGEAGS